MSTNNISEEPRASAPRQSEKMEGSKMVSSNSEIGTWGQLAESLYEFLNRRNTTIEYSFVDMEVMVPKSTGADAPQARWKFNGAMRLRTWEE